MKETVFNKEGVPLMMASEKIFAITNTNEIKKTINPNEKSDDQFKFKNVDYVSWGTNNDYPEKAINVINSTGVLSTAIDFKSRLSFSQGLMPMLVDGYDDVTGDEILKPCEDDEVRDYLRSYSMRNYITSCFRDMFKFGNCFPVFYFNADGSKIVQLANMNARHCRLSKDKTKLLIYPNFKDGTPSDDNKDTHIIDMLDENDPFLDLESRKALGKLKGQPIAFPRIKNFSSNNDYYAFPAWNTAWQSGWIEIANSIPKLLAKAYANAMTLMWHIQIPASFWENNFPLEKYNNNAEDRKSAIADFMSHLEDSLCGAENESKAIFTDYTLNLNGKAEEKWIIDRLENEIDAKERLTTSAAANSEILFSLMINPAVLGAGMPGGSYSGNAGSGSDIREAAMVSIYTINIEQKQMLDPLNLMFHYNGKDPKLVIKYREKILTTLNTGNSQKTITV